MPTNNEALTNALERELAYDPVDVAEKMSDFLGYGRNSELILALASLHNARKGEILAKLDDTGYRTDLNNYQRILVEEGFEKVLELDFIGQPYQYAEKYFIYWNPEGTLICFDTYDSNIVNSAKLYYQVRRKKNFRQSSGGYTNGVWCGDHDARESLRYTLNMLRTESEILPVWQYDNFMWLLHYMDTKTENYDYEAINRERLAMLPEHVQTAIKTAFKTD